MEIITKEKFVESKPAIRDFLFASRFTKKRGISVNLECFFLAQRECAKKNTQIRELYRFL